MRKEAILDIVFRAIDKASPNITKLSKDLGLLGGPLSRVGQVGEIAFGAVAGAAGLAAGVILSTFDAAAQFEDQMAGINAVLGLSDDQFAALSDEVMRLGRETRFTAQDAGVAIEALARGGAEFEEIMGGAGQAALELAAATKTSMAEAGATTLALMRMFHLEGDELSSVVNSIAGAVNNANMTLTDFRYAMQATGGIGNAMGVTFQDVSAALLMFGQSGLVGERAGTGLKILLTSLVPKNKDAAAAFESLGFTVNGVNQFFDQTTGKIKPLGDVFQLIQDKIAGLDAEERVKAFRDMFGTRAATMQQLFEIVEQGGAGFQEFQKILADTSAADIAEARMNSWIGIQEKLAGEFETMKIVVGNAFLPLATTATSALEKLASAAQPAVKAFAEWLETGLSKVPAALQELTGINLDNVIAAFSHFENADFGEGLRRFLLDVLGQENLQRIDDFSLLMQNLWKDLTSEESKKFIDETVKNLQEFFALIVEHGPALIEGGGAIIEFLGNLVKMISGPEGKGGGEQKGLFHDQIEAIKIFKEILAGIPEATEGFQMFLSLLATPFDMAFWNGLGEQMGGALETARVGVVTKLTEIGSAVINEATLWVTNLSLKTGEMAADLIAKGQEWLDTTAGKLAEITTQVQTKWEEIKLAVANALAYILDQIQTWWDRGLKETTFKLQAMLRDIQQKFEEIKSSISKKLEEAVAAVKQRFEEARDTMERLVGEAKTRVMTVVGSLVSDLAKKWQDAVADAQREWDNLKTKVETAINNAKTAAVKKAGEILTEIGAVWTKVVSEAETKWGELKAKIESGIRAAIAKIGELKEDAVTEIKKLATNIADGLVQGFKDKLEDLKTGFWGTIQALLEYIRGLLPFGGGGGGPGTSMPFGKSLGGAMAMGMGDGFAEGVASQQSTMAGAIKDAATYLQQLTQEQFDQMRDPFTDFDLDKMRSLRKAGMDMNRTGKGGFVAASRRNYFDVWSRRHGLRATEPVFPPPPTRWGELPPPPPGAPGQKGMPPPMPPITVNVTMEVAGAVIGRWTKAMIPHLAKQADQWMYSG